MSTLRDNLLPVVHRLRAIPHQLGFRSYKLVEIVTVQWSGGRIGQGVATVTHTPLTVGNGAPPKVRSLTREEIIQSGGLYSDEHLIVGPLTPFFGEGGTPIGTLIQPVQPNLEVHVRMVGEEAIDVWASIIKVNDDRSLSYTMTVKRTGKRPQGM